jgi:hypothetical protein
VYRAPQSKQQRRINSLGMSIVTDNGNILKFIQVDFSAINHELRYIPNKLLRAVYLNFFLYFMDEGILLDDPRQLRHIAQEGVQEASTDDLDEAIAEFKALRLVYTAKILQDDEELDIIGHRTWKRFIEESAKRTDANTSRARNASTARWSGGTTPKS